MAKLIRLRAGAGDRILLGGENRGQLIDRDPVGVVGDTDGLGRNVDGHGLDTFSRGQRLDDGSLAVLAADVWNGEDQAMEWLQVVEHPALAAYLPEVCRCHHTRRSGRQQPR